ncbi:MAG: DUF5989 family protein [Myxococcota bacterium]
MGRIAYSGKLLQQFVRFAFRQKVYWIVPLIVIMALFALLGGSVQSAGTLLLYTLF